MKKSKLKITFLSLIFAFATLVPVVSTGNFCAVAKVNNYNANYKKELTSFALEKADEISTTATEGPTVPVSKPTLSESESTFIYNGKEQTVTVTYDSDMLTESGTKSARDVGTYELTYTILDASGEFTDGSKTCTLTWKIVKAEDNAITNLQITGWAYGEDANTPTATSTYGEITYTYVGTNGTNYSSSATAPTKAGTYKVIASVSETDNYNSATAEKEFTITKAKLTAPTIKTDTFTYDGSVQTLELTGFDETTMSITGNTATNAGSYTAKVSLNDTANYEWADEFDGNISWQINKATKALPTLGSVSYNGTTRIAEVEETDEYTVVTNNGGVNVGKYNVTIKMSDELYKNYKWVTTDAQEVTITFEIIKATDNAITEIIFEDFVYGTDPTPATVKAKYGADNVRFTIDGEETDFSALELKAGSHTLVATIAGTANYNSATLTKVFNVNKIVVKQSDLPTISGSYVYNGKEQTVSLVGEKDYLTISGDRSGTNAKNYTLTISLKDDTNYEFDTDVVTTLTWTIEKGVNEFTTPLSILSWTYGEAIKNPTAVSKWGTVVFTYTTKAGEVVSVDALSTVNAGEYIVTATVVADGSNYDEISESVNFTISKAKVTKPTANSSTFTYNKTEQTYTLTTNSAYTIKNNTRTNAGSQTVIVSLINTTNYEWENGSVDDIAYTFTINKAKLTAPTIKTGAFTYDASVKTLELTGFDETTMSITGNTAKNAGSYTAKVSLTDADNYEWADEFDGNISWQINKATKDLPTLENIPYNGKTQKAVVEENDEYIVVTNNGGVNVGKYDVIIKMSDELYKNYKWKTTDTQEVSITFEITKATNNEITNLQITGWVYGEKANTPTATSTYGEITYTYVGTNGTNYSSSATAPTTAGTYKVIASVSGTENYNSANAEKEFTITKAKVTAPTIITSSFTYDGTVKTLELNGFDETTMSITGNTATNAGSYTAKVSLNDTANYEWANGFDGNLDWNITKIQLEAPQENLTTFTYDKTEQTYTLTTNSAYTIKNNTRTNAGSQTVTISLVDKTNYEWSNGTTDDITYTFTIGKAVVDVIPTVRGSYTYTGETITLVLNNYDSEIMSISGNSATVVGNYNATITLNDNYMWAGDFNGNISWSISKAKLAIPSANVGTFVYTGSEQTLDLNNFDSTTMSIVDNSKTNVGEYTAVITLLDTDNYEWAEEFNGSISWSITKASNKFNSLVITGWSLDGEPNAPTYSVDFGTPTFKYIGIDGTTYESDEAPTEVGNYKLIATVVATENYDGATAETTFSVAGASNEITNLSITGWVYGEYDEATNKPSATARYGDIKYYYVLRGETSYTEANLEVPTNAGNYTVIAVVEGTSEYAGATSSFNFTIEQAEVLESNKPTISGKYTYTGNEQTVVVSGKADYMSLSGEVSGTDAKTYTITITLDSNHKWADGVNNTITWEIGKATAQISDITINGWVYGQFDETINTPTANTTFGTARFVYLNAESEVVSDIINANAGTYTLKVIVDGTDNYLGAEDNTKLFTITKAKVSVVPSVKADKTFTYNAEEQTLQITDLENYNESIMTIVDGTNKHTNAGSVDVSIKLDSNHVWADNDTDTITIVWVIEKAQMTITNVSILGWVYGEYDASVNTPSADALYGATVSYKYFNGEGVEVTSLNGLNAGTYKLVAIVEDDENANYLGTSAETEFIVSKKTISTQVTAQNAVYTGEELTAMLQNFDDSFMTIVENANKHTNAGRYTISIELDGNHTWAEGINGEVEWVIEQKTITTNPTLSETEFVYNGETKEVQVLGLDGILVSATNLTGVNANTYTVVITINSNYKWAEGFNGTLIWTITKATDNEIANLTITGWKFGENANLPTAAAKYGEITYTYEGINGTIYESSSVAPTKVGNYKVTASVADSTNYNSCTDNFEFAISKGNVVVNETPQSKTEGEEGAFNVDVPENSGVLIYYAPTGTTNWSTTIPTAVGVYDVKVVVESTNDNYNAFEKTVVAGFKISAKVEQTPTEPEKQKGLTSSQIGILITAIAIGFIAIALLVAICIHHKNAKRAEQFLDEQDEENRDN